jgi:hypothetical protein
MGNIFNSVLTGIFGGLRGLLMGWSSFYGGLFGSLTGLLILWAFGLFLFRLVIWTFFLVTGNSMFPVFQWDRTAEVMNHVTMTESAVHYRKDSAPVMTATIINTLPYPVAMDMNCIIKPVMSDSTVEVYYSTDVIGAGRTLNFYDETPQDGSGYIGPVQYARCTLEGGKIRVPWWRPRPQ